jgi:hypothetical protein
MFMHLAERTAMKKHLRSIVLTGGAAAAAIILSATAALAATWTVTNGGSFTNISTGTGTTVLTDTTHPNTVTCSPSGSTPASTASGTLPSGTGLSSALGTITALAFNNCSVPISGTTTTVTNNTSPAWGINGDSYSSGVTTGHISSVNSTVKIVSIAGTCTFNVTGNATGTYNNTTHVLHLQQTGTTFTLTISGVTGGAACNGVTNGDAATFDTPADSGTLGGYTVTTTGGSPTITSP